MRVLVDSIVLLDILTDDPHWAAWSEEKLAAHAERDLLAINPIIYAEVAGHFSTIEELDNALSPENFQRLPLPYEAGFLASRCFLHYRYWLATQKDRTPVQIAKSYRKRYGVDWPCAIHELALLGVTNWYFATTN